MEMGVQKNLFQYLWIDYHKNREQVEPPFPSQLLLVDVSGNEWLQRSLHPSTKSLFIFQEIIPNLKSVLFSSFPVHPECQLSKKWIAEIIPIANSNKKDFPLLDIFFFPADPSFHILSEYLERSIAQYCEPANMTWSLNERDIMKEPKESLIYTKIRSRISEEVLNGHPISELLWYKHFISL